MLTPSDLHFSGFRAPKSQTETVRVQKGHVRPKRPKKPKETKNTKTDRKIKNNKTNKKPENTKHTNNTTKQLKNRKRKHTNAKRTKISNIISRGFLDYGVRFCFLVCLVFLFVLFVSVFSSLPPPPLLSARLSLMGRVLVFEGSCSGPD